jgi:arylsulfatase
VRIECEYRGGGRAKGGTVTRYVDGQQVGEGRVDQTEVLVFSTDETCDMGNEFGSPVAYDYPTPRKFSGEGIGVEIDVDKDAVDLDHLISPEERLCVASHWFPDLTADMTLPRGASICRPSSGRPPIQE